MSVAHPQSVGHEPVPSEERSGWGPRDVPAWVVSFGVHLLLLAALGTVTRVVIDDSSSTLTTTMDDISDEQYQIDPTLVDQVGTMGDLSMSASAQTAATVVSKNPQEEIEKKLDEEVLSPHMQEVSEIEQPATAQLSDHINTTGAQELTGGVEGAIDRLAFEIAGTLREDKTLVIWLFDVSPSLADRRQAIAERFENVYKQLGQFNVGADRALKTAVAAFGDKLEIITPEPVDDVTEVVKAVRAIKSVDSGTENTFAAVQTVMNRWLVQRTKMRRQIMLIVVTDEAGSDPDKLEQAIHVAKRYGIRCYCVGDTAPFGRKEIEVPFTLESGENVIGVMDRGPETYFPERLQLAFWGSNGSDLDDISSGFGPYALTRLCAETNGLFLMTSPGNGPRWDPQVMRAYQPDYRPISDLEADVRGNVAKRLLVEIAQTTRTESIPQPQLEFPAMTDTLLRQEIDKAQRPLAEFEFKISRMADALKQGEKDRAKIKEPRWRAGYDLAMGRLLAMKSRALGYNSVLAEMKSTPRAFKTPENNLWRLKPSPEIISGATVNKLAKEATVYLTRVIDEHPGTPWAVLAERELGQKLGWDWEEGKMNLYQLAAAGDEQARLRLADEEEKRKKMRQTQAPPPKRKDI